MKPQSLIAAGLVIGAYLVVAILVHHEQTKNRADFTLCPLCHK
jgi:hypothetical protein